MAQMIYTNAKLKILTEGLFATGSEDYRVLLVGPSYSPSAAHQFVADVVASELTSVAVPNYARKSLAGLAVTLTGTSPGLHADMVTYTDLALAAPGSPPFPAVASGIVYRHVTNDADSWLLAYLDTITATTNGDDLIVTWDTDGIVYIP